MDSMDNVIITGGAGFIGSHFVDALMEAKLPVTVIDNLSSGRKANLHRWTDAKSFNLLDYNLEDSSFMSKAKIEADVIIHMASNPEVRDAEANPRVYVKHHISMMRNVLELACVRDVSNFVFASSSTVYGDAEILPTPEVYQPLKPISAYGKMKLRCEEMLVEKCEETGLRGLVLRFANIVGPRSRHGVIIDLLHKLQANPKQLEVLGDGTQRKSYLHVQDCVEASLLALQSHLASAQKRNIFNVGNTDWLEVRKIASLVTEAMGLKDVKLVYRPAEDGRGWKGDVKVMLLDITRLTRLGWKPRYSSEEAIRLAAETAVSDLT